MKKFLLGVLTLVFVFEINNIIYFWAIDRNKEQLFNICATIGGKHLTDYIIYPVSGRCDPNLYRRNDKSGPSSAEYFNCDKLQIKFNFKKPWFGF